MMLGAQEARVQHPVVSVQLILFLDFLCHLHPGLGVADGAAHPDSVLRRWSEQKLWRLFAVSYRQ